MMMILSITMMAITTCYHPVLIFRNVSPLTKMAPRRRLGHYNRSPSYNMVSPNDPTANACKVVDFHGEKIASFNIHGKTMLCLPQAFEIFLKNLVGGLHTVYTKCKRLDIHPLVCNVEQVERERDKHCRSCRSCRCCHHCYAYSLIYLYCVLYWGRVNAVNFGTPPA